MSYDLNNQDSYSHLMGSAQASHLGSQSSSPGNVKDPGGSTNVGSKQGVKLPQKSPNGLDYS